MTQLCSEKGEEVKDSAPEVMWWCWAYLFIHSLSIYPIYILDKIDRPLESSTFCLAYISSPARKKENSSFFCNVIENIWETTSISVS